MDILRNLTNFSGYEPDWLRPSLQLLLDIVVPNLLPRSTQNKLRLYRYRTSVHLETRTRERGGAQRILQINIPTNNSLEKGLSHYRRTGRTGVRVVQGEVRIDSSQTELLKLVCHISPVINIGHAGSSSCQLRVAHKPRRGIGESSSFPGVVGRLTGDDHIGALGLERLGGILNICRERQHCLGDPIVGCATGLAACARTVATPIIGGSQRATIVVSEFDDHPISRFNHCCNIIEPTLTRV